MLIKWKTIEDIQIIRGLKNPLGALVSCSAKGASSGALPGLSSARGRVDDVRRGPWRR